MKVLSGNLDLINSKINDLQKLQEKYKNLRKEYEEKHGIENGDERLEKAMNEIRATLKQTEDNKNSVEKEVREMMHAKERTDAAIEQVKAAEQEAILKGIENYSEDASFEIPESWVKVDNPTKPETKQDKTDTNTKSDESEKSITNDEL